MIYQFEHEEIKYCGQCPCYNDDGGGCLLGYGGIYEQVYHDNEKPPDCPLVAISKTETTSCEWCDRHTVVSWGGSRADSEECLHVNYCPNCGRRLD